MSILITNRGFTLISLMIVFAIIGILAAIAYPSYIDQVRQSRRTDAISLLMRAANREERYYTTNYAYAKTMKKLGLKQKSDNGWYTVEVTNADAEGYQLTATPIDDQKNDKCKKFELNQLGEKSANGQSASSAISQKCW